MDDTERRLKVREVDLDLWKRSESGIAVEAANPISGDTSAQAWRHKTYRDGWDDGWQARSPLLLFDRFDLPRTRESAFPRVSMFRVDDWRAGWDACAREIRSELIKIDQPLAERTFTHTAEGWRWTRDPSWGVDNAEAGAAGEHDDHPLDRVDEGTSGVQHRIVPRGTDPLLRALDQAGRRALDRAGRAERHRAIAQSVLDAAGHLMGAGFNHAQTVELLKLGFSRQGSPS